jgi:hypothetical protein
VTFSSLRIVLGVTNTCGTRAGSGLSGGGSGPCHSLHRAASVGPVRAKPEEDKTMTEGNSMTKSERTELGKLA